MLTPTRTTEIRPPSCGILSSDRARNGIIVLMGKFRPLIYLALGFSLVTLLFIFLSCGSPKQFSAEAPTVISIYPAASVEGIPIDARVSVIFDRDMDPASIDSSSFSLSSPEGAVTGAVTYDASTRTAIFTPSLPLDFSTIYTATISTAVKSSDGGQMSLPYQWSFTTSRSTTATTTTTMPGANNATSTTTSTTTTTTTIIPGWEIVGTAGFSAGEADHISLAIYNGTPYVAYLDHINSNKATVMKFNGSNWESVGTAGFSADYVSLSIYNGTPYVAVSELFTAEVTDGKGTHIISIDKATVMKFNGSTWESIGIPGFSSGEAYDIQLAIDNGTPYVAYQDRANSGKATVMKFNGTSWENVGTAGFSAGRADYISLAVYNGTPYVAFKDGANSGKATVMKFNGTSWENVGTAGFSAGEADHISLAVYNGTPYVAFRDWANSGKAMVMKFNGSTWESVGTPGFSAVLVDIISLAVYNGIPFVASDGAYGAKATVMSFNGNTWESVGTAGFSAGRADYISLAVYNGTPYVAYGDEANDSKATVMKYVGP